MNRVFHARIVWYQYLFLLLLGVVTFRLLWDKAILLAGLCMLMLVLFIERFIHTQYTITPEGELILSAGRFSKPKRIRISDIFEVEKRYAMRIGSFYVTSFILIQYGPGEYVAVIPAKEREFMELLEQKRE